MVDGSLVSPFPPLRLSDDEKHTILTKIDELLVESLAEYERFLHHDRATVSETQWKQVTKRDGMTAYRKRRVIPRESDSTKVHTILVVGEADGTVEDAMLASVNPSPDLTDAYEDYIYRTSTFGSALLCPVIQPTTEEPDRTVRIAWDMIASMSATFDTVIKPRDYVVAIATGTVVSSTGERLGYLVYHSVDVASAPPVPNTIRATRHMFYLYRQVKLNRVHVYIVARSDPKGRIPTGAAARVTSEAIINSVIRIDNFAAMKKRTFLLNERLYQSDSSSNIYLNGISPEYAAVASSGECNVCGKRASGMLSSGKPCSLCGKPTCSSCFKPRRVILSADKTKKHPALTKKIPFCFMCEQRAMQVSGWDLNLAEVAAARAKDANGSSTHFSSTASSSM